MSARTASGRSTDPGRAKSAAAAGPAIRRQAKSRTYRDVWPSARRSCENPRMRDSAAGVAHHHPHSADHTHALPAGAAVLRARGRRLTRQRRMIWEVLAAEPDRHLSAGEVCERVRAEVPSVTPSTVYRTLDVLVEAGLALRTDLGGDRVFYEPAHEHPHHHLVCERCGAVRHVHDDALGDLRTRVEASSGYALAPREITLFGTCPDCRRAR